MTAQPIFDIIKAATNAKRRSLQERVLQVWRNIMYCWHVSRAVELAFEQVLNRILIVAACAGSGIILSVQFEVAYEGALVPFICGFIAFVAFVVTMLIGVFWLVPSVRKYYRTLESARQEFVHIKEPRPATLETTT